MLPDPEALAPRLVERCLRAAASLEFTTFLVGVRTPSAAAALPDHVVTAWKSALKRRVGLSLALAWESLGRRADFHHPELVLVCDEAAGRVKRVVRPVCFYGRYRKRVRDLPQTRTDWRCPACAGRGCPACRGSGRRYPISLEDLIGRPAALALDAPPGCYALHGMGREDVDVRCLGPGRPFVLEVRDPRRRTVDLAALVAAIEREGAGRVELPRGLRPTSEALVGPLKEHKATKRYRAVCALAGPTPPEAIAALPARLEGATLEQRTPLRVAHRRKDKVRLRRVLAFAPRVVGPATFEVEVEAEAGTYIKELLSGDEGRTRPSVAELLGLPARCAELDVIDVRCDDEGLLASAAW